MTVLSCNIALGEGKRIKTADRHDCDKSENGEPSPCLPAECVLVDRRRGDVTDTITNRGLALGPMRL
jgi:hypothetical protein